MRFSPEQDSRLKELGVPPEELEAEFPHAAARNARFQRLESALAAAALRDLDAFCTGSRQPRLLALEERLSAALRAAGFIQVHTPCILSRSRLEKMGITRGSAMEKQVFWLDERHCLRPMLAPHLYEFMRELGRTRPRPLRLFEVGTCFRKETQGLRHANEFTMLNLVEMDPNLGDARSRLEALGALIMEAAKVTGWRMEQEDSAVYGATWDFVDADGQELASAAAGPLPMDDAWGITEPWAGIGFGLERLCLAAEGGGNVARAGRSLSYLNGIRVRL